MISFSESPMEESPETIFGNKILITGFGRIAKTLAKMLVSMGADVTVCARKKSDIAWAEIFGCRGKDFSLLDKESDFKIIFNTVPTEIFTKESTGTGRGRRRILRVWGLGREPQQA